MPTPLGSSAKSVGVCTAPLGGVTGTCSEEHEVCTAPLGGVTGTPAVRQGEEQTTRGREAADGEADADRGPARGPARTDGLRERGGNGAVSI